MKKQTLAEMVREVGSGHYITKPQRYYDLYDKYLGPLAEQELNILELGVFEGESTKLFSRFFKNSKIVATDINIQAINFSECKNVHYTNVDQTDVDALTKLVKEEFPEGIDIIIDDASHIGYYSQITFNTLFPFLKKDGFYIIEDWGTAYWDGWPDGSRYQPMETAFFDNQVPKRIPSHDFGMVGFCKWLVEWVGCTDFRYNEHAPGVHPQKIQALYFYLGMCIAIKA